ncbi:hypothetical protein GCM10009775_09870 [Microbacterium aoyamense]|uniref:Uncharacterized protein n=2 Tax=Microbacterium aoyamense TaxID=344166 RepID=A0ABP5APK9_9MICO
MPTILSISAAFAVGLVGCLLLMRLVDRVDATDLTPSQRWRGPDFFAGLEQRLASDVGGLFVSTVIAIAAAIAPHTLESGTGFLEFWWWVGFAPAAIMFVSGTISAVQLVYPLERGATSWTAVALYYASGLLFLFDVSAGLP